MDAKTLEVFKNMIIDAKRVCDRHGYDLIRPHLNNFEALAAELNSQQYSRERHFLVRILDDASGDISDPNKRIWPIRRELYLDIKRFLDLPSPPEGE